MIDKIYLNQLDIKKLIHVDSVNGETGIVELDAAEVGADEEGTALSLLAIHEQAFDHHQLPDVNQKLALAGTGNPSGSNKFVTNDDSRLSNSRLPVNHASSHGPGGSDAMAIDTIGSEGSLRTLGTSPTSACAGNDIRLSDSRAPTAHAATHRHNGSDEISSVVSEANVIPKSNMNAKLDVWISNASSTVPGLCLLGAAGGAEAYGSMTRLDASTYLYGAIRADGNGVSGIGVAVAQTGKTQANVSGKYPSLSVIAVGSSAQSVLKSAAAAYSLEQALTLKHAVISDINLTSCRYWFGLSSSIGNASKPTAATVCLVYDSAISSNWQLCTYDGSAGNCVYTNTGLVVLASTTYEAEIVCSAVSVSARIRTRNGPWSSTATYAGSNMPSASTKMFWIAAICNRTVIGTSTLDFLGASFTGQYV